MRITDNKRRCGSAAGDVITGFKTVVHAVDGAKKAAEAMMHYMEQKVEV